MEVCAVVVVIVVALSESRDAALDLVNLGQRLAIRKN